MKHKQMKLHQIIAVSSDIKPVHYSLYQLQLKPLHLTAFPSGAD